MCSSVAAAIEKVAIANPSTMGRSLSRQSSIGAQREILLQARTSKVKVGWEGIPLRGNRLRSEQLWLQVSAVYPGAQALRPHQEEGYRWLMARASAGMGSWLSESTGQVESVK